MYLRNIKTPQIKNLKQKQLNELRYDIDKFQSETKKAIKKEIYEIKEKQKNSKTKNPKAVKGICKNQQHL
jgi:hypothetical protein